VNAKNPTEAMQNPPWMDSFFYFDSECQLIFDQGRPEPVALFNYLNYIPDPELIEMTKTGGAAPGFFLESIIPKPNIIEQSKENLTSLRITIENPRETPLPFGLFLWEKSYLKFVKAFQKGINIPDECTAKYSPGQGVFLRFNLKKGKNILILSN
jgi:hypothetical protein